MSALNVLIVDDDADSASEMAELLDLSGYRAFVATSLAEARAICLEAHPDCALVDIRLGKENGLDLALEWQGEDAPDVLLLSGAELTAAQAALFETPPPILLKPADLRSLSAFLEAARARRTPG